VGERDRDERFPALEHESRPGTLGLRHNDPSVYWRADSVLAELRALSADMRANPKRYLSVCLF